jgi:hypothetical protein
MTKKRLAPEDQALLEKLRNRLLLTIQFVEGVQAFPSGVQFRRIVESTAAKGDLRAMRLIARDIDAMTLGLMPQEREGLEAILQQRLGIDKDAERAEWGRRIAGVLRRGSIASEKERRHLEDYAEMLEATGGDPSELEAVRRLLATE